MPNSLNTLEEPFCFARPSSHWLRISMQNDVSTLANSNRCWMETAQVLLLLLNTILDCPTLALQRQLPPLSLDALLHPSQFSKTNPLTDNLLVELKVNSSKATNNKEMPTQERQCKICTFKYAYGRGITTAQILTIPIERVILVDDSMYLLHVSPNCSSSAKLLN